MKDSNYNFRIGDLVERTTINLTSLKIGDQAIVRSINNCTIWLEGKTSSYDISYFKLVKPKETIINQYDIY